jgi:uncharacterized protein
MKSQTDLHLTSTQEQALSNLRRQLYDAFEIDQLILYGSIVRQTMDAESDIDLLILTKQPLSRMDRHKITDRVFDINLQYGTNLSTLVIDRASWETGTISILPIHSEVTEEGIPV